MSSTPGPIILGKRVSNSLITSLVSSTPSVVCVTYANLFSSFTFNLLTSSFVEIKCTPPGTLPWVPQLLDGLRAQLK